MKCNKTSPDKLAEAIKKHFDLFVEAYGKEKIRPKNHYLLHLPDMLAEFGTLIMTFVHERKHRAVKRYTQYRCNLRSWSASVIEEISCHNAWELQLPFFSAI